MSTQPPTIFLVDDDSPVLRALARLLHLNGYFVRAYSSANTFLAEHDPCTPGCVVLDFAMPELSGLEVQARLCAASEKREIIFLTGRGDIQATVKALKAGAVDFLCKPVKDKDLLSSIAIAVEQDNRTRQKRRALKSLRAKFARLTCREREVLTFVIAGWLNKQIAYALGTVEKTIKVHRGRMMRKLGVRTVAELVRAADKLGIPPRDRERALDLPVAPRANSTQL